ncbi:hypothetical protein AWE51_07870 [Aquimarina aggregata]|uniref:DUF5689 domain-containing protein n=1 Tax=Aquimarina aggregata TaxID=1642818 RepID=A0A162Z4X3_9FLAO|nr:DUF5689 domain-containing protein [Aquimarina aggregata]KZS39563.1 hypothetical protein AWE51_07870 [Aquimarina aggregata]
MSTHYLKPIVFIFILTLIAIRCTPEEDFKTPPLLIEEPIINGTVMDLEALLGILAQEIEKEGENAKASFTDTNNYSIGYVVSSDKGGNFFKELILQNAAVNPTAGIRVLIDNAPLFTSYEFGRKVFIKLDGLSIGIENGVPTLGVLDGNTIAAIPSFSVNEVINRSSEVFAITPLETTIDNFTDRLLNLYVKVNNIQFNKNIVQENNAFTFAAEPNDKFDGERIIESCETGRTTILSTSTFSDFRGLTLPNQQGSFTGILTKNFLGNAYNLALNDPDGLVFDIENRCDPEVVTCTSATEGKNVLFEEEFTGLKIKDLEEKGWININLTKGDLDYDIATFSENEYVQITGFRSKEPLYEIWLLSPEIDMSTTTDEVLNFDLQAGFDNGNILQVFVSNDFTDDINTATWTLLDAQIPRGPINAFGDFSPAGPINLSCIEGSMRIGFKYVGGDPRATTRYHIDNIKIKSN